VETLNTLDLRALVVRTNAAPSHRASNLKALTAGALKLRRAVILRPVWSDAGSAEFADQERDGEADCGSEERRSAAERRAGVRPKPGTETDQDAERYQVAQLQLQKAGGRGLLFLSRRGRCWRFEGRIGGYLGLCCHLPTMLANVRGDNNI
jgi:hypothetical protein